MNDEAPTEEASITNVPRPVRPSPSFVDRHLGLAAGLVAVGLVVLIVKPWSFGTGDLSSGPSHPLDLATTAPISTEAPARFGFDDVAFDPGIFGGEPAPQWELWPAAVQVTYGLVAPLGGPSETAAGSLQIESPAPLRLPPLSASPKPPVDGGPAWPATIHVPAAFHVFVVGIDMPRDTSLTSVDLSREAPGGSLPADLAVALQPTPWPDHVVAFGIPALADASRLQTWAPGIYRVDLVFEHLDTPTSWHRITRSIEIVVEAPGPDGT